MILHICGNLASGKTTTADHLRHRLPWPRVSVGRIRNALQDEVATWEAVLRLWSAWDSADLRPGRSGIWISTGFNWNEERILHRSPPQWLTRIWLTAPPHILKARLIARGSQDNTGYWPYPESFSTLQDELMGYDLRTRPLPWIPDVICDTSQLTPDAVVDSILSHLDISGN